MGETKVAEATIVKSGNFDLKDFYQTMHSTVKNSLGYGSFSEDDFSQFPNKKEGDDVEFHWTFERDATMRETYVKFRIWIECKIRGIKKVKVKSGNETKTMHSGDIEIVVKGVRITDPEKLWKKHKVLKLLNNFGTIADMPFGQYLYEKILFRPTLDGYWKRLYDHVFFFENEMKAYLEMPHF